MHRQGFDLQMTQYDERGWRATFYTTGMEHSPTSATGTAWERTPWARTQRAAWEALDRAQAAHSSGLLDSRQPLQLRCPLRRIGLAVVLVLSLFAAPLVAAAQPAGKMTRIGYLAVSPRPTDDVFREALRQLGYVEGQNLTILYRWGESGDYAPLAEDLVRSKVDLIVAVASPATRAAKEATQSIPIVITDVGD